MPDAIFEMSETEPWMDRKPRWYRKAWCWLTHNHRLSFSEWCTNCKEGRRWV